MTQCGFSKGAVDPRGLCCRVWRGEGLPQRLLKGPGEPRSLPCILCPSPSCLLLSTGSTLIPEGSASKGHRAQRLLWILPSSCAHPSKILVRLLASPDSACGRTQRPNHLPACLLLRTISHFKLLRFKLLVIFLGCWEESVLIVRFDKVSSDQL